MIIKIGNYDLYIDVEEQGVGIKFKCSRIDEWLEDCYNQQYGTIVKGDDLDLSESIDIHELTRKVIESYYQNREVK